MAELRKTQEIVGFKSYPKIWLKEKNNIKPNTVRLVDNEDNRFIKLRENDYSTIRIFNTQTNEYFEREIEDVTFFTLGCNELVIISWRISNNWKMVNKYEKSAGDLGKMFIENEITFQELINLIIEARIQRDKYKEQVEYYKPFKHQLGRVNNYLTHLRNEVKTLDNMTKDGLSFNWIP